MPGCGGRRRAAWASGRCAGFQAGNDAAVRHGCYSILKLAPRQAELRAALVEGIPLVSAGDAAAVDLTALVLSQFERATIVLAVKQHDMARAQSSRRSRALPPRPARTL